MPQDKQPTLEAETVSHNDLQQAAKTWQTPEIQNLNINLDTSAVPGSGPVN